MLSIDINTGQIKHCTCYGILAVVLTLWKHFDSTFECISAYSYQTVGYRKLNFSLSGCEPGGVCKPVTSTLENCSIVDLGDFINFIIG